MTATELVWKAGVLWSISETGRTRCVGEVIRDACAFNNCDSWSVYIRGVRVKTLATEDAARAELEARL